VSPAYLCQLVSTFVVAFALVACRDEATAPPVSFFAADERAKFSDWSAPTNLGPIVNSPFTDIEVSISKDGRSLYLASNRPGGYGGFDIWVCQRAGVDDPWGPPQNVGPTVNTAFNEQAPAVTIDGHRIYFFSNRPGGFGGNDLYVSRRRDKRDDFAWQPPENLGSKINSAFNENLSAPFENTLYFNSNRPGGIGGTDIYVSTLQANETFSEAMLVPELSSPLQDAGMAIRRDGLEMIFASNRAGSIPPDQPGAIGFDLWVATRTRTSDPWSPPTNLGPVVNTAAGESRVALSFDGTALYMISDRPGGSGNVDVWVTTRTKFREPD
jgi:Tol biopolymer transport system component